MARRKNKKYRVVKGLVRLENSLVEAKQARLRKEHWAVKKTNKERKENG